jgi:arginine decarboxylase
LSPGEIIYAVMAESSTNEPHRLIAASIGVAIPSERDRYGYLSEYHSYGETEIRSGDKAEDLAAQMLATTLGVPFDPDTSYDERKELWKISSEIVKTKNITQTAIGDKYGMWTTVIAAAVLIP